MNSTLFSILLVIIGLFFGICLTFLINHFRVNNAESKIKIYAEKASDDFCGNRTSFCFLSRKNYIY